MSIRDLCKQAKKSNEIVWVCALTHSASLVLPLICLWLLRNACNGPVLLQPVARLVTLQVCNNPYFSTSCNGMGQTWDSYKVPTCHGRHNFHPIVSGHQCVPSLFVRSHSSNTWLKNKLIASAMWLTSKLTCNHWYSSEFRKEMCCQRHVVIIGLTSTYQ